MDTTAFVVGGGNRSMVGSRRSTSAGGVDRTTPYPSGRRGSGVAPTIQGSTGRGAGFDWVAGVRKAAAGVCCCTAGTCQKLAP
jgi:hypothetical protein